MTMEVDEEERGDGIFEEVTSKCLERNIPAKVWLKLAQQAAQGESDQQSGHDRLATSLLSYLQSFESTASLVLHYIAVAIQDDDVASLSKVSICTASEMCQAVLDNSPEKSLSDDIYEELTSILDASSAAIEITFTTSNLINSMKMLQRANERDSDSCKHLAMTIIAGFCFQLEQDSSLFVKFDEAERTSCMNYIQSQSKQSPGPEKYLLENLLKFLEARLGQTSFASIHHVDKSRSQVTRWTEEESLAHFSGLVHRSLKESGVNAWPIDPTSSSSSAIAMSPEMVNLVYFLIDSYSSWQTKVDAVKMLLKACSSSERSVQQILTELLFTTASACATIAGTPNSLGGDEKYTAIWRSALCGLLPNIIAEIKDDIESGSFNMTSIVKELLSEPSNALAGCEVMLVSSEDKKKQKAKAGGVVDNEADMMLDAFIGTDEGPSRQPVRAALIRSLQSAKLLEREGIRELESIDTIREDMRDLNSSCIDELDGSDTDDLVLLLEQKVQMEMQEEGGNLFSHIAEDYPSQCAFSLAITKTISECISSRDLDGLAKLCRLFNNEVTALEVCLLYTSPELLLHPIVGLLEGPDGNELLQNGEEPSVLGVILLFVQLVAQKALEVNYTAEKLFPCQQFRFFNAFVRSSTSAHSLVSLSAFEQDIISSWITALFDSEGISDELIKSSSPQLMLRLTPTIISQSISACCQDVIDLETLRGGLTYFLQELLNYNLPVAISWVTSDLFRCHSEEISSPLQDEVSKRMRSRALEIRFEVLSMLLGDESCPSIVHALVADRVVSAAKLYQKVNEMAAKMKLLMDVHLEPKRSAKTHLWIKISQGNMKASNVDALMSLDASFDVVRCKRGTSAALQIIYDNILLYPKSQSLSRSTAASLCLAHLQDDPYTSLIDDVLVAFTYGLFQAKLISSDSAIQTLQLTLQMLNFSEHSSKYNSIQAAEAIVALRIRQLLKNAKNEKEVTAIFDIFENLFHLARETSLLKQIFS